MALTKPRIIELLLITTLPAMVVARLTVLFVAMAVRGHGRRRPLAVPLSTASGAWRVADGEGGATPSGR